MNAERRFLFPAALDRQVPQGLSSFGPESGRRRDLGPFGADHPAGSPGWRLKSEGTEKPCGQGGSAAVSAAFFGACRRCLLLPRIRPPLFPRRGCSGRKGEKLFSKEDGAPKEGKKNLWDGPGAKPAGCPFFGGGRKGRLFCF
ncbi:MAG: hypothetical protein C6P37_08230 [Caldibacillus debilis]|uniref:Uncharacterized protein n=1 Tax=Caldibacillus debilis TaxID=301148 RepID=A0A3E0K4J0_9BACI|nr:hypothetical protein [Bacillaceae bacterium]REJ19594.1 MAG: hypothetical protein C6W57_01085 [Caldibacillus debilis]REJ28617.1 MAG: hypothetical protein C6P37_08230 [Caldibacillus debilis]